MYFGILSCVSMLLAPCAALLQHSEKALLVRMPPAPHHACHCMHPPSGQRAQQPLSPCTWAFPGMLQHEVARQPHLVANKGADPVTSRAMAQHGLAILGG